MWHADNVCCWFLLEVVCCFVYSNDSVWRIHQAILKNRGKWKRYSFICLIEAAVLPFKYRLPSSGNMGSTRSIALTLSLFELVRSTSPSNFWKDLFRLLPLWFK